MQTVFDPVRKRHVQLTPEEEVRQGVISLLHDQWGCPYELMQVESAISLNGLTKRCDVVIYNKLVRPILIVECKKPEVPISQKVVDQACRYNLVLKVPYLYLTNGCQHLLLRVDFDNHQLQQLRSFPKWEEVL